MIRSILVCIALLVLGSASAQKQPVDIQRIEPPFWLTGMKNSELQILVYGKDISTATATIAAQGVTLKRVEKTENPNYQFLFLEISASAKAGMVPITFQTGRKKESVNYELKAR